MEDDLFFTCGLQRETVIRLNKRWMRLHEILSISLGSTSVANM